MNYAINYLKNTGATEIQLIGGGYSHFWPGVPDNLPAAIAFFKSCGWEFVETTHDLTRDLDAYKTPSYIYERIKDIDIRICLAEPGDSENLLSFEEEHFPYWHEFFKKDVDDGEFKNIIIAKDSNGEILGSLLLEYEKGNWYKIIGEKSGALGAVGVAESMRRKGIGLAMVAKGTEILIENGIKACLIGWTPWVDWYGKLGYKVWRKYQMSWKKI